MTTLENRFRKFGEYVECDQKDLLKCLEIQKQKSDRELRRIGDILLDEGIISKKERESAVLAQRMDRLNQCSLFSSLTWVELRTFCNGVEEVDFNKDSLLISQDVPGDCFYLMIEGEALVYRIGDDDEKISLITIKSGDSVGEMSYFASGRRLASVRATTACHMLKIDYDTLEAYFDICPGLAIKFLNLVTQRLKESNIRFEDYVIRTRQTERTIEYMSNIVNMPDMSNTLNMPDMSKLNLGGENFDLCQKITLDNQYLAVFYDISNTVAHTTDVESLFSIIVNKISSVLKAERSSLFLLDNKSNELWSKVAEQSEIKEIRFPSNQGLSGYVLKTGKILNIKDAYKDFRFSPSIDKKTGFKTKTVLCSPVVNRNGDTIGVVQAINKQDGYFEKEDENLLSAISSQIAVTLTTAQLIQNLKELLSAFIESMAGAIDEKSPYTGGHIARVVELTMMIAEKINQSDNKNFHDIFFSEDELEELRIAAWMHDIGKIVTPQHIIDKGNKLEKLMDRINLIQTRFQLIETLIQTDFINKKNELKNKSGNNELQIKQLENDYQNNITSLKQDFDLIASSNNTGDFMPDGKIERIKAIAKMKYTFNGTTFPYLTDDEAKNLCIRKGTLTDEERQIVENHVKATQKITGVLPFPDNLARVPEIASSHHEKLDGSGYPHQYLMKDLAIQSRILAVADIFEALTAKDRPYREPMKLSQAIKVMEYMKKDNHIDGEILDLFFNTGIYKKYAQTNLNPEQLDIDF